MRTPCTTIVPTAWDTGQLGGLPVLHCGLPGGRSAIRVPYTLGSLALAYLCWLAAQAGGQAGGVIADRRTHTYFLIPSVGADQRETVARAVARIGGARLCDRHSTVILPSAATGTRWRHGEHHTVTDTSMVLEAMAAAHLALTAHTDPWSAACHMHASMIQAEEAAWSTR